MRTHPTTGQLGPRNPGPHGETLRRRHVHRHKPPVPRVTDRDRSLRGKARRLARKAARRA